MTSYVVIAVLIATVMLLAASVRVHRYSRGHMTERATLTGRGLYVTVGPGPLTAADAIDPLAGG